MNGAPAAKRRFVIAANWKMNKTPASGEALIAILSAQAEAKRFAESVDVILCPPFILLDRASALLKDSPLALGAQNMHFENDGAYTGEISGAMLAAVGCRYVILGHSERRTWFGETDAVVNRKARKALECGLRPIICVGETLAERESDETFAVVERQTRGVLAALSIDDISRVIIAYEPVWAIGTGRNATPPQAQEVHSFIRGIVAELYGAEAAERLPIQYGGSMKPDNARELLAQKDVDGGLIGGASLVAEQFIAIVEAAALLSPSLR